MDQGELALTDREFNRVKARVRAEVGIALSEAKRTLVVSRLGKIVRKLGAASFDAYLDYLERQGSVADAQDFINALTTNLTRFWREEHHFEHLATFVEGLMRQRPRLSIDGRPRLRLWSAGCSTGQEPYTMALALFEALPELRRWDFRVLATDIDTAVLAKAALGTYPESELAGLAPERTRLFERVSANTIRVPAAVREVVAFKRLNLMANPWPMKGAFDAVFCRNVAIYFDKTTQATLFERLGRAIVPEGFLYIGHSENLSGGEMFRLCGKTVYQRRLVQAARDAA